MSIRNIKVENFKSFKKLNIDFRDLNIVVGANASGKSNFISALRFVRDIAHHGLTDAIAMQGGVEFIRNKRLQSKNTLKLKVVLDEDLPIPCIKSGGKELRWDRNRSLRIGQIIYELDVDFDNSENGFTIVRDRAIIVCDVSMLSSIRPSEPVKINITRSKKGRVKLYASTLPSDVMIEDVVEALMFLGFFTPSILPPDVVLLESAFRGSFPLSETSLEGLRIFDFDPRLSKRAVTITGVQELQEDAANLTLALSKILRDQAKSRQMFNLMNDLLPFSCGITTKDFADVSKIFVMQEQFGEMIDFPASQLSDGTITLVALLIALFFDSNHFVVIEEPERNLHPLLMSKLAQILVEASRKKQILITTHNSELIRHINIDDLLLISRNDNGFSAISRPKSAKSVQTFLKNNIGIDELFIQDMLRDR